MAINKALIIVFLCSSRKAGVLFTFCKAKCQCSKNHSCASIIPTVLTSQNTHYLLNNPRKTFWNGHYVSQTLWPPLVDGTASTKLCPVSCMPRASYDSLLGQPEQPIAALVLTPSVVLTDQLCKREWKARLRSRHGCRQAVLRLNVIVQHKSYYSAKYNRFQRRGCTFRWQKNPCV